MVGVCTPAPTNQARLFGHELDMLLVTKAAWLRMGQPALVNAVGIRWPRRPQEPLREPLRAISGALKAWVVTLGD
jgi:hypothetical protein